jgi:opacity protein-like surface antigen
MPTRAIALAFVLTLVTADWAATQPTASPALKKVTFGVKGGVNVATVVASNAADLPAGLTSDTSVRTGFIVGGYLLTPLHGNLGIQFEVLYAQKGAKNLTLISGPTEVALEMTARLSYVELPVLVRYSFRQSGRIRPYAYAGPSIGLKTSANVSGTSTGVGNTDSFEEDVSSSTRTTDVGIAAGGGVEFGRLVVDARFTNGLTSVSSQGEGSARNRTFALMAGIRF